ncbi:MAG: hypothetical protein WC394_01000 [Candidatus Omnitrophota bacterium]|jgi:uncharacterized protein (UPF0333 family)
MGLNKRGQSLLEYSILFAVILSAILIMQFYIKRSYQARLKAEADSVGQQYAPGHTTSVITITNKSTSLTTTKDGKIKEKIEEISPNISTTEKVETVDSFSREW